MKRFALRRFIGGLVTATLVVGAPGPMAYNAAAQTMASRAAPGAPARAVLAIGVSNLAAPSATLAPAALSVVPALSAAAAAPAAALATIPAGLSEPVPAVAAESPRAEAAVVSAVSAGLAAATVLPERMASSENSAAAAGRFFDGAVNKKAGGESVPATTPLGAWGRAARRVAFLTLAASLGLFSPQRDASAQGVPVPGAAQIQVPEDTIAATALPRPVQAAATFDRQDVTVGERIQLAVTLRNTSDKPVTLQQLRGAIQEALPDNLELQDRRAEAPVQLLPGETKIFVYEAIAFNSGIFTLDGGVAVVAVDEVEAFPKGIEIVLPPTELSVRSVLTPDWKEKGLRDIVGVLRAEGPSWMWLAAIPLGILMLVGVQRLVAMRRLYPKLDVRRLSLFAATESGLKRLEDEADALDTASFYARYQDLLSNFMVDFAGLPKTARDARTLARDLRKSFYDAGQADVAARLAAMAEEARFAGAEKNSSERRRALIQLRALIESVAARAGKGAGVKSSSKSSGLMGAGAIAGLQFANPWLLLLLVPYVAYLVWSWRTRGSGGRFALSSAAQTSARRNWRERLTGLPHILRLTAIGLMLIAVARPIVGTQRNETVMQSTDTMMALDVSPSMQGAKFDGMREAVRVYVEEQRRGTNNRVGMVTFAEHSYLDVKLTTDYDALVLHLKELEMRNATAVGKGMLTAIAHFAELNARELDAKDDPRVVKIQELLRLSGLPAALAYIKDDEALLNKIIQPERTKIVVVFTDGQSNVGIDPREAAVIAERLGIKVYTVGVGSDVEFDEATLVEVANRTGAKYYHASDPAAMRDVLLEISRLEKSPVKIVASVSVNDYTSKLALLAFLLFGVELVLANTRLRTLYGLAFLMASNSLAPYGAMPARLTPAAQVQSATAPRSSAVPPEVLEGNRLYNQGRFGEALKKYGEAIKLHPDMPELHFNMADAYLRLGENAKADAEWQKYLSLTPDPRRQSQALFNLGNSALQAGNAEKALELYKEALRRDSNNQDAKWNLEALQQAKKDQQDQKDQKDQKESKDQKQKGKQGKQKGKPSDQQGKPSDQQGQPSDQQGKPSDQQGKSGDQKNKPDASASKPGDQKKDKAGGEGDAKEKAEKLKNGASKLGEKLGEQEKEQKDAARRAMTRRGSKAWGVGLLSPAFLLQSVAANPLHAIAGHGVVFSSSIFFWAVGLGLPVMALILAWGIKKKLDAAKRLSPVSAPKTFRSWWGSRRFLARAALRLASLGLVGLAAGDPRGGMTDERINFGGKDIVVTVDDSYSMVYAEDGRMERTRKELNDFFSRLTGTDRVGLVVFSGQARTAAPISIDYGNFEFKINRLDAEALGLKEGTDLAAAVRHAANHFELAKKLNNRQRIMIVISDGDVEDAELDAAISAAQEHGVTVYTIGVGTEAGTKMKIPTEDGAGTEDLIDEKTDAPALTRLNETTLRKIAEQTGGAYFRTGDKTSIESILEEVARLQKGHESGAIKSPRPIGVYFVGAALLLHLLSLRFPEDSLLKRGAAPSRPSGKDKPKGSGGVAMMGVAFIPLGAWPQIEFYAAGAAVLAGLLALESWSGGAITRRVREFWQRLRQVVEKGVADSLPHLYDLREKDESRLSAFVKGWHEASDSLRQGMIPAAQADEALWREMLTAAYLSGAAPETLDKVLGALRRGARQHMEPLAPIVDRIAAQQEKMSWMDHSDARIRVAALQAAAAGMPVAAEAPARKAPTPRWFFARATRGVLAAILMTLSTLTGISAVGAGNFRAEQRAAAEAATKLFYAEDVFIFSDRYVDERIPREVLPALRRWYEFPSTAGADFERVLTMLRESPDPKADNILVAIFRRAGILPLTEKAEDALLGALIDRDNDALWTAMDDLITQSRGDAGSARLLVKLVTSGIESGNEKAIAQIFRVLKTQNEKIQQLAARALYAHLAATDNFFPQLYIIQAKHAGDPMLQMWTMRFALSRVSGKVVADGDVDRAKAFVNQALINAMKIDAVRVAIFKQTPPDKEAQAPPSMVTVLAALAEQMQANADAASPVADVVRHFVSKATTNLIKEGEALMPWLHERLLKDGVLESDVYVYDYDRGGRRDEGFDDSGSMAPRYRDVYKLTHLRTFAVAVNELGGAAARDTVNNDPSLREYVDRVNEVVESLLSTGKAAGLLSGDSPAEKAAQELLSELGADVAQFSSLSFDIGVWARPDTLNAAQLANIREAVLGIARFSRDGQRMALLWNEKIYLAKILEVVDAVVRKNFPDEVPAASADDRLLALARLSRAVTAHPNDADFALRAEKELFGLLTKPAIDALDVDQVLRQILLAVSETKREATAIKTLVGALRGRGGSALVPPARLHATSRLIQIGERAERSFPDQNIREKLVAVRLRVSDYVWRDEFMLHHYAALKEVIDSAAAGALAGGGSLNREQSAVREAAKLLPQLASLAAAAGMSAGSLEGELAAELVNPALANGYQVFPGTAFNQKLLEKGFLAKGAVVGSVSDYKKSYTRNELIALRDWLKSVLAAGIGWDSSGVASALTDEQKDALRQAIAAADKALAGFSSPAKQLHALQAAPVLAAMPALTPGLIFMVLGLVAAYFLWRAWRAKRSRAGAPEAAAVASERAAIPAEVLARHHRIELAARRLATAQNFGTFRSRFIGAGGTSHAESRPYQQGDDIRQVDWKASAKRGEVYTKRYEQEREVPLMLIVDVSKSGRFGTRGQDKRTIIEDAAAVLALAAAHASVRVGAILGSDRVEAVIPARSGMRHVMTLIDAILKAEPTAGTATDLRPSLETAGRLLGSRAMIAVLSDFFAPDFKEALSALSARHDVRALRVTDPAELAPLPDVGLLPVVDAETGATRIIDTSSRAARAEAAAAVSRRETAIEEAFMAARLRPILVSTEGDPLEALEREFNPKAKQPLTR